MPEASTKDLKYLRWAVEGAKLFSTCGKAQYMAIMVDQFGHVIGTGVNGGPKGMVHCQDGGCPRLVARSAPGEDYANCFHGSTLFQARDGFAMLAEEVGKEVKVLTRLGWKPARVEHFGEQVLSEVYLKRGHQEKVVLATPGHRWFTIDSHRVEHVRTTEQLVRGHCLKNVYAHTGSFVPCEEGIKAGLVFGDGSCAYGQPGSGSFIELAGKKTALAPLWAGAPGRTIFRDMPRRWKTAGPPLDESFGYLFGWLQGYFAADGHVSRSTPMLSSVNLENLEIAVEVAALLGIPTGCVRTTTRLGYGSAPSPIHMLTFPQGSLPPEFFLLDHHREGAGERGRKRDLPRWVVKGVRPVGRDDVFCAVVPGYEEFALVGDILTSNCIAIHAEMNCIIHCDYTLYRGGATMYVNGLPCFSCAKVISNSGIRRVVYLEGRQAVDRLSIMGFLDEANVQLVGCEQGDLV